MPSWKVKTVPEHKRFAVFILTHGRPKNVITAKTLKKSGYTGRTYIIIDNEDPLGDEYRKEFGAEWVIEFDKKAVAETFDTADTQPDRLAIVYARNACFQIARNLELDYFVQLDDDYNSFLHRFPNGKKLGSTAIRNMDDVIEAMLTFLDDTGAKTVAFAQGGDLIGGINGGHKHRLKRKAMNSFFLKTNDPVEFIGKINDDVNAYIVHGSRGQLFFTVMDVCLTQTQTQKASGGMTDAYLNSGTYVKSFYSVIMSPSCVKIGTIGVTNNRFHHAIKWDNAVPKIIHESYKKIRTGASK